MMRLATPDETEAAGRALAALLAPGDVIAISGELGAGKTTFARGLLRGLGFEGDVQSPSFPIVIAYDPPEVRLPLWHVDLYRIEDPDELEELGLDEARADGALLIEWPERMGPGLWPDSLQFDLRVEETGARVLTAKTPPAWESRWPPR